MLLISKFDTTDIDAKIAEFESKYGITLPERYRQFMLKYNGGMTPETKFKAGKESSDIRAFYGFGDVGYSFSEIVDMEEWIKSNIIPIASDSFGNHIVIGLDKEKEGKIFFSDHEKEFKITLLSDTLEEFFTICKSKKIRPVRTMEERERDLIANGYGDMLDDGLRKCWQEEIDLYGNIHQEKVSL